MIGYWIVQVLGAIAGVWVLSQSIDLNSLKGVRFGIPAVGDTMTQGGAVIVEAVTTFFFVLVIYGSAVDKRANKAAAGLYIGLAITMGALMAGNATGGALNPARFLGSAVFASDGMAQLSVYLAGPLLGGLLAGIVYTQVFEEKGEEPAEEVPEG